MSEFIPSISTFPSVKTQLFSALWQKAKGGTKLPTTRLCASLDTIDEDWLQQYNKLIGWPVSEYLHPAALHVLAMPMHLSLLLDKSFPFSVKGLIHTQNQISQKSWLEASRPLQLCCYFAEVQKHPKGWLFCVITEACDNGKLVWREKSTFLSRFRHQQSVDKVVSQPEPTAIKLLMELSFDKHSGLGYARCSGDYNPIHLWPWSAKLFGFSRHIAHGMLTMARCTSELLNRQEFTSDQLKLDVNFKRPLFLPGKAQLFTEVSGEQFCLKHQGETFLLGRLASGKTAR